MSNFKEGDKVRIKEDCSNCEKGDICVLLLQNGGLTATTVKGKGSCQCTSNWELVDESIIKTTMTNIKTFVKNMSLSADEKALRQAGLKTETGDYTQEAVGVVLQSLCAEQESKLVAIAQGIIAEEAKTK